MCRSCLNIKLSAINDYDQQLTERLSKISCECCRSYPSFLKRINDDLKVICLTKIKRHGQVCSNGIRSLYRLEALANKRVKVGLMSAMEQLDDEKEKNSDLCEGKYLDMANELKSLHDFIKELDEAEHR